MNNTICIDFDGVIFDYSEIQVAKTEQPITGSMQAIKTMIKEGYKVVICTARHESHLPAIKEMLQTWGLSETETNIIEVTNTKPNARMYIDDKAVRFTNWDDIMKLLR